MFRPKDLLCRNEARKPGAPSPGLSFGSSHGLSSGSRAQGALRAGCDGPSGRRRIARSLFPDRRRMEAGEGLQGFRHRSVLSWSYRGGY